MVWILLSLKQNQYQLLIEMLCVCTWPMTDSTTPCPPPSVSLTLFHVHLHSMYSECTLSMCILDSIVPGTV